MYHKRKCKRGGKYVVVLLSPHDVLRADIFSLNKNQLRSMLVRLVILEKKSRPLSNSKHLLPYRRRLREMRLSCAKRYVELSGLVSSLVLKHELPPSRNWPGIIRLIETKGCEGHLID